MNQLHYLAAFIPMMFLHNACRPKTEAQRIIDRSIEVHGGKSFERLQLHFDLRGRHYEINRHGNRFEYRRTFANAENQTIADVLHNKGFERRINGVPVELPRKEAEAFSNSVNSVAYFALLPYRLNDPGVIMNATGKRTIDGKAYFLVEVTFQTNPGGEPQDVFLYWIESETYLVDFLAYNFQENGGGVRFRKAINRRKVGDIILQDYVNYTTKEDEPSQLYQVDSLYAGGLLIKVSEIKLENPQMR